MSDPAPSRISKIIDFYYSELRAALKEHKELLDADDLFENPPEILSKGWGFVIGEGENTERCLENGAYYYRRNFTIVLTRDYIALNAAPEHKLAKQKLLLEDANLALKRLARQNSLVDGTTVLSFKADALRDSGPRPIVVNDTPYHFIELTVSAEYRELTT